MSYLHLQNEETSSVNGENLEVVQLLILNNIFNFIKYYAGVFNNIRKDANYYRHIYIQLCNIYFVIVQARLVTWLVMVKVAPR